MRILWLSHLVPYPPKGGVLQRAYHLIHEIARYHTVDLLAFNQQALMEPLFEDVSQGLHEAYRELACFCRYIEFMQIESIDKPFGQYRLALRSIYTKDTYTINWLKSSEYATKLNYYIQTYHYDLVHFDTISLVPYLNDANTYPTVLDHHNIESHMLFRRAEQAKNPLKKWYFFQEGDRLQQLEKNICPEFSLNIICSDIDKERLKINAPGSTVECVPNGVDIDYFKPDYSVRQKSSLVFAGTLSWYPNIEAVRFIANEIWPRIKALVPGISFDLIGANPPQDIIQLGERDANFRVHGFVNDVRPYLNKAAVYVCPIRDGGGTKLKILDAFAMAKAVVAHPIACEGINVQEGHNVLFAQRADEYAQAIKRLMDDEQIRHEIGQNARALVEREYAYRQIGQKLSDLYQYCVSAYHDNRNRASAG